MHPDQAALYRGILATPHADLPRLVYADWLEEHGRAERAEFIRVQIELANSTPADDGYCDLVEREIELQAILEDDLRAERRPPLPAGWYCAGGHERGFAGWPGASGWANDRTVDQFAQQFSEAAEHVPCDALSYQVPDPPQAFDLLRHPACERLRSLSLGHGGNDRRAGRLVAAVADSPHLGNLRYLSLAGSSFDSDSFDALARLTSTPELRALALGTHGWSGGSNALRAATWRERLVSFRLPGLSEFFPALADGCAFPNLTRLEFGAPLSAHTLRLLNDDALYPRLRSLTVRDSESADWLERGPMLERPLAELTLASSCRWSTAFAHLLRSPGVRSVRRLKIGPQNLELTRVTALTEAFRDKALELPELRQFAVSGRFDRHSLLLLAQAPIWETVTSFDLECNVGVEPGDWAEFFRLWNPLALRHLSIRATALQTKGGVAFAANRALAGLRVLELSPGKLSATAFRAILAAPPLQNLVVLRLSHTGAKKEIEALADPTVFPHARRIELRERNLPPAVADKLRARPGLELRDF
jgi:uncharacterized protein (TIGR02996 family)